MLESRLIERGMNPLTKKPKQKYKMKITIAPADNALTKYTHCALPSAAKDLADRIDKLEAQGYKVTGGISTRCSVPNSYKGAYKMYAPFYRYCGKTRQISLVPGKLENRPRGGAIPAHLIVEGTETPAGYRALSKANNIIDLIPVKK